MKVELYDKDLIKDDFIGEGTVNLNQLLANPGISDNQYVELIYHGKSAGRVLISMEYQGPQNWGNNPNQRGWGSNTNQSGWGNQGYQRNQGNSGWVNNPNQDGWGNNPQSGW